MTVDDFLYTCVDDGLLNVDIFSCEQEKVVWSGPSHKMPDEYRYAEVSSWDVPEKKYHMTFNID